MQATITSKGQVTIPKPIRDLLHLNEGTKLEFRLDDKGELHVTPVTGSVKSLKGMAPATGHIATLDDMSEAIGKGATGE